MALPHTAGLTGQFDLLTHSPDGGPRALMFRAGGIFPTDPAPHHRSQITHPGRVPGPAVRAAVLRPTPPARAQHVRWCSLRPRSRRHPIQPVRGRGITVRLHRHALRAPAGPAWHRHQIDYPHSNLPLRGNSMLPAGQACVPPRSLNGSRSWPRTTGMITASLAPALVASCAAPGHG